MSGWITLLAFAVLAFALIWRFGKLPRHTLELAAAMILIGIAGYAWQGTPGQPGVTMAAQEKPGRAIDALLVQTRQQMSGRFGADQQWLDSSERFIALGQTQLAVLLIRSGLRDNRNSPALWVGLGDALVAHGDGLVSPAAEFAYRHAGQLAPNDPAPPFFYGVALARSGRAKDALAQWKPLLARAPANAPWRETLAMSIARLEAIGPE